MTAIDQLPEPDKALAEDVVEDVMNRLDGQPYYVLIAIGRDLLAFSIFNGLYYASKEGGVKQTVFYRAALKLVDELLQQMHRYFEECEQSSHAMKAIDHNVAVLMTYPGDKKIVH